MKIVVIGSSIYETTCAINESIKDGSINVLDNRIECGGGCAGNIAYLLGKWGAETYIASMVGSDDFANRIKKEYESVGVRTDFIETSYDKGTGRSLVLVNNTTKENTVFDILSNAFLKKYSFSVEPDIIVTDGNDYNAAVATFDKFPKSKSFIVLRRLTKEAMELCRYANYIIINKNCAEALVGTKIDFGNSATIVNTYNKIKQKYNTSEVILMLGDKGSVYSINSNVKIMPPAKMNVVDTNGAGDVYAGGFVYGMANNFGLEKSIAYATIAASISTTRLTSRNSIPSLNEVSNYYDGKFGAQNNPNTVKNVQTNREINKAFEAEKPNMDTNVTSNISSNTTVNTTTSENTPTGNGVDGTVNQSVSENATINTNVDNTPLNMNTTGE